MWRKIVQHPFAVAVVVLVAIICVSIATVPGPSPTTPPAQSQQAIAEATPSPSPSASPESDDELTKARRLGATAICRDGTYSFSAHRRGTCSHHGGVARWLRD